MFFFLNSVLFGFSLAIDAVTVSVANGIAEPEMKKRKSFLIAGIFAFFQFAMPLIGWVCVHYIAEVLEGLTKFIPFIALLLLTAIGIKMIIEGARKKNDETPNKPPDFFQLILQGVATSIDALSVGFTIASYTVISAIICASIIAVITFALCLIALFLGKKIGEKFTSVSSIIGGIILILIGIEIIVTSFI